MNRLKKLYNQITKKDKLLHFVAGTLIYLFFCLFLTNEYALGIIIFISMAKEAYDLINKKASAEHLDWIMTALPAVLIYIIL